MIINCVSFLKNYLCVQSNMCVWAHRPVCMWRLEADIRYPLVLSACFFEAGSLSEPGALASSAKLEASNL